MGKQKRVRQKLHLASKREKVKSTQNSTTSEDILPLSISPEKDNLFAGVNIDFNALKLKLDNDDLQSVKSFKSIKSELGSKIIPKKDKLKLRREVFLKKIDVVKQLKKESKVREKRKKTSIIGDTNPLHDALPSLESLLNTSSNASKTKSLPKKKAIEKSRKRKKNMIKNIDIVNSILRNKEFQKNPLQAVSQHVRAVVESERANLPKNK